MPSGRRQGTEEFLDQMRFEIESEIELCGWHSTESCGEEE